MLTRAYNQAQYKLLKNEDIFISWAPLQNEYFLGDPIQVGFSDYAKKVPTMAGSVYGEFTSFGPLPDTDQPEEKKKEFLEEKYGEASDELISLFEEAYPEKDITRIANADFMCRPATVLWTAKKAEVSSAPAYLYQFALDFDVNGSRPAWHCSDIPFVFYNSHRVPVCNIDGVTERIEDEVAGSYVSFARYGDPNHEGMRKWEAYTDKTKATMVFDEDSYCRLNDFDGELMKKLEELAPNAGIGGLFKLSFLKQMESDEGGDWFY